MTTCHLVSTPTISFLAVAILVYINGVGITMAARTRLALKFGYKRLRGLHHSICHGHGYDRLKGGGGSGGYVHISHNPTTTHPRDPSLSFRGGVGVGGGVSTN